MNDLGVAVMLVSVMGNIAMACYLFVAKETQKIDKEIIDSKDKAIDELLEFIEDNGLELDNPYNEFLAYLDEETENGKL